MRARLHWLAAAVAAAVVCGCPGEEKPDRQWREAFDATDTGWLLNVWGPTGDDLYAVGGAPDAGRVVHYDGTRWSELDLGLDVPLLNWVHGFGPDSMWVVGNEGTILHWNGTSWAIQEPDTPVDQDLWGIWGAAPDDLWAVGGNGRAEGQATILRYDGATWRSVPVPELERSNVWAFFKVWGTGADDVWIVGQRGAVLRWNGTGFVEHLVGTSEDLISLWGTGPDHVAVVGGRGNGVLATWNGTEWHTTPLAPLPGLNGVWMRQPDVVHSVGVLGTIVTIDFDTHEVSESFQDTADDFHAVFGDPSGRLTAVGGNLAQVSGPYRGIAYARPLGEDE